MQAAGGDSDVLWETAMCRAPETESKSLWKINSSKRVVHVCERVCAKVRELCMMFASNNYSFFF